MSGEAQRKVLSPLPDVRVQALSAIEHDEQNDSVTFYIRNDNPDSVAKFAVINITYVEGIPEEMQIGVFPEIEDPEMRHGYSIGRDKKPEYEALHQWLGVHANSKVPFKHYYVTDQEFARYQRLMRERGEMEEPSEDAYLAEESTRRAKADWLEFIFDDFSDAFDRFGIGEGCKQKCEALMHEIIDRVSEKEAISLNNQYLRELLDDPFRRGWAGGRG